MRSINIRFFGLIVSYNYLLFQIFIYDVRSSKPLLVKDHNYGLPINSIRFHDDLDLVLSADSKIVKIWHQSDVGKSYTCKIKSSLFHNNIDTCYVV